MNKVSVSILERVLRRDLRENEALEFHHFFNTNPHFIASLSDEFDIEA